MQVMIHFNILSQTYERKMFAIERSIRKHCFTASQVCSNRRFSFTATSHQISSPNKHRFSGYWKKKYLFVMIWTEYWIRGKYWRKRIESRFSIVCVQWRSWAVNESNGTDRWPTNESDCTRQCLSFGTRPEPTSRVLALFARNRCQIIVDERTSIPSRVERH